MNCGCTERNEKAMTNREYLESLSKRDLAVLIIAQCEDETEEYDWDESPIDGFPYTYWRTSDGEEFLDYNEAIDHEVWWLRQPYRKENE